MCLAGWADFHFWSFFAMQFGVASGVKLSDGAKSYGAGNEKDAVLKLDPEQQAKYDEIIALLLAGGYFRARISTLDQFDKVPSLIHPILATSDLLTV